MVSQTKIEWADAVWNPVTGCTPVSEGCQNCYAKRMATRLRGRFGYPEDEPFRVTLHEDRVEEPLRWRKPKRIFVCSMGDLFHPDVSTNYQEQVWRVMLSTDKHTFLVLTKRSERMRNEIKHVYARIFADPEMKHHRVPDNIWLGVTAENQQAVDERIPILLQIPAAVHWVSCEPLLGPVDLLHVDGNDVLSPATDDFWNELEELRPAHLDWIVVGGETGPNARPMHPDWVRSLRNQAVAAGVPFFFKSWGEYIPSYDAGERSSERGQYNRTIGECWVKSSYRFPDDGQVMVKVGKKAAGRLLDGRTWDEVPEI
ncbi:MAG: phage Gp37/Gp68 family protein [Bacillota bacterium]|nr:phage Gp37/Gp68 family protein [Bacillota bacterium]